MHLSWAFLPFIAGTAIKLAACLYSFIRTRAKFLSVKIWFVLLFLQDVLCWFFLIRSGPNSFPYAIVYFWADFITLFAGLIVLIRMAESSFRKAQISVPYFRSGSMAMLGGIGVLSFVSTFQKLVAAPHKFHPLVLLGIALEQHAAAAGMLASVILFLAMTVLLVPGARVRRIVAGFAILYSCTALPISAMQLFGSGMVHLIPWFSVLDLAFLGYAISEPENPNSLRPRRLAARRFHPAKLDSMGGQPEIFIKVGA